MLPDYSRRSQRLSRSISAENPDGAPGGGARATQGTGGRAARDLGLGWKVSPSVRLRPGETFQLADIAGPGVIRHLWCTTEAGAWRQLVLRACWDDAPHPALEVPLGDFFCNGWGVYAPVMAAPVVAAPHGGLNSYWPMPFRRRARLEVVHMGQTEVPFFYQVDYSLEEVPADALYLHAQWRRSNPTPPGGPHPILDAVEGHGQYVGTYLAWGVNSGGWWGEGEVKFYLDGDGDHPTICGTGTEDYFGGAWDFEVPGEGYVPFSSPYLGLAQVIRPDGLYRAVTRFGMYRFHLSDPVVFHEGLRANVQALGWRRDGRYLARQDDVASTCWFYLDAPGHAPQSPLDADNLEVI